MGYAVFGGAWRLDRERSVVKYLKNTVSKSVAIEQLMGMFDLSREDATKYYMAA